MNSKIICKNEIENVTFKLSSNDDNKQYQQLYVENEEMNDIIQIAPCDYFTAVNAVIFSETLEEVKERFDGTWAEDNINLDKALEYINRALEKDPKNPYYIDTLGWIKFKQEEYKEALDLLLRALNLADDDIVIFEHIGDVYLADGNKELAKKYYKLGLAKKNDKLSGDELKSIERMEDKLEDL